MRWQELYESYLPRAHSSDFYLAQVLYGRFVRVSHYACQEVCPYKGNEGTVWVHPPFIYSGAREGE